MNAAYNELMKLDDFDCVVFHDVDMLPEDDRNTYACGHVPTHLSLMINKYNYRYPYGTDFGGVTMMSALNYSEVNGHTNVFWGWGREDSDIEHRIHAKHMKIEKPEIFDSGKIQKYCPRGPLTLIIKDPVSPFARSLLNIRFILSLFEHKFIFERSSSLTLNRSLSLM